MAHSTLGEASKARKLCFCLFHCA
eukprot:SAG31_NODE_17482_length_669_cov_0.859649_1_plen_23_part_10